MKKLIPIFITLSLVLSGLGATALSIKKNTEDQETNQIEICSLTVPQLIMEKTEGKYLSLQLKDTSTFLMESGKPKLPKIVKTFELPFGAKNIGVKVLAENIIEQALNEKVKLSPPMLQLNYQNGPNRLLSPASKCSGGWIYPRGDFPRTAG